MLTTQLSYLFPTVRNNFLLHTFIKKDVESAARAFTRQHVQHLFICQNSSEELDCSGEELRLFRRTPETSKRSNLVSSSFV